MTTHNDQLVTSSLPHRPFRDTTRELIESAAAVSSSYVVTRSSADEFRARAAALASTSTHSDTSLPHAQLTVVSDTTAHPHVLATSSEQARRLSAVRLEHRLHGRPCVVAARTEAALTHLLDAPGEGCDEAFMLGATELSLPAFAACEAAFLRRAGRNTSADIDPSVDALIEQWGLGALASSERDGLAELTRLWQRSAQLRTFGEAVAELMNWPILDSVELPLAPAQWREFACSRPHAEVRDRADVLGILPDWDAHHASTASGHFPVRGGIEYAIARSLAAAPHADLLWLVAPAADLNAARSFAEAITARYPDKLLAYQLTAEAAEALAKRGAGNVQDFTSTLAALGFALHVMNQDSACARLAGDCVHLT